MKVSPFSTSLGYTQKAHSARITRINESVSFPPRVSKRGRGKTALSIARSPRYCSEGGDEEHGGPAEKEGGGGGGGGGGECMSHARAHPWKGRAGQLSSSFRPALLLSATALSLGLRLSRLVDVDVDALRSFSPAAAATKKKKKEGRRRTLITFERRICGARSSTHTHSSSPMGTYITGKGGESVNTFDQTVPGKRFWPEFPSKFAYYSSRHFRHLSLSRPRSVVLPRRRRVEGPSEGDNGGR